MTLRVLTLNLWHDAGPYPRREALIRDWIDRLQPDLIGFQEALRGPSFDQCARLLEGRGYHLDYEAASHDWRGCFQFGNAVASRWPQRARHALALPDRGDGETRSALAVEIDAPMGPLLFAVTHLHWQFHHGITRERQAVALFDFVWGLRPPDGFPPLLVGDFNAEPDSAEIRYLCGLQSLGGRSVHLRDAWRVAGSGGDGMSWSNRNDHARPWLEPDRRIDYVFAGPPQRDGRGRVERCRVVCDAPVDGVWPSDHFGVFAELRSEPLPDSERLGG